MSHKRTRESPLHHTNAKASSPQRLTMSHDETFMSHRETSDASGTLRKIRGKSKTPSEIRKMAGNCLSGASAGPRFGLAPAIARGKSLNCAPEPSAHFPTVAGRRSRPGLKARHSAGHGDARPAAGRDGNSTGIFGAPAGPLLRPLPAMSHMGHFCLMNEPSLDATNPMSPWRTSRVLRASAVRPFPARAGLTL